MKIPFDIKLIDWTLDRWMRAKKPRRPIVCLDFDGVVHSYTSGWKGPRTISDPPMPDALMAMEGYLDAGLDVCIHSSRSGYWGGRTAMRAWLKRHAGSMWHPSPGHAGLEDVRFPLFKPAATVTIDDRAIQFVGQFPSPAELRDFKPWKPTLTPGQK